MARVLLAGDAEGREEEYMASGPYTCPLTVINVQNYKQDRGEVSCLALGRRRRAVGMEEGVGRGKRSIVAQVGEMVENIFLHNWLKRRQMDGVT
jgi:hypothetical protein